MAISIETDKKPFPYAFEPTRDLLIKIGLPTAEQIPPPPKYNPQKWKRDVQIAKDYWDKPGILSDVASKWGLNKSRIAKIKDSVITVLTCNHSDPEIQSYFPFKGRFPLGKTTSGEIRVRNISKTVGSDGHQIAEMIARGMTFDEAVRSLGLTPNKIAVARRYFKDRGTIFKSEMEQDRMGNLLANESFEVANKAIQEASLYYCREQAKKADGFVISLGRLLQLCQFKGKLSNQDRRKLGRLLKMAHIPHRVIERNYNEGSTRKFKTSRHFIPRKDTEKFKEIFERFLAEKASAAEDLKVVNQIKAGGINRFEFLMTKYEPLVRNKIFSFVPEEKRDDIIQEIFIKTYAGLGGTTKDLDFPAWFNTILTNYCIDFKRKRNPPVESIEEMEGAKGFRDRGSDVFHSKDIDITRTTLLQDEITSVLDEISDPDRTAFVLHVVKGLDQETIASRLQISRAAVKGKVFRGRRDFVSAYVRRFGHPYK